jgi:hypothetical protein
MTPPQPGDPASTATGQAHVRQLIDRYAGRLRAEGAIRSPAVEQASATADGSVVPRSPGGLACRVAAARSSGSTIPVRVGRS